MKFEGIVTNTIYRNSENGYTVLALKTSDGDITCTGIMPSFNEGDNVLIQGDIVYHETYGEQIQVKSISLKKPTGKEAIIKFLSSGSIPGVGKKTAELIYDEFKDKSIDVIFDNPDKLLKVPGIGKKKLEGIKLSTEDLRDSRDSLLYLQGLNISYNLAIKIYNKYKSSTVEVIKTNPYKLVEDIRGVGFVMADNIARNMQIKSDSKFRISSAINYILNNEAEFNGHCAVEEDYLVEKTFDLLNIDKEKIKEVLREDVVKKKIILTEINDKKFIYDYKIFKAEKSVAMELSSLNKEDYIFDVKIEDDLEGFSDEQVIAIKKAFENMVLLITGGPGTGKTTIIKAITKILTDNDLSYKLAAPTGRAAKRIQESTDEEAYTIHRLIGIKPDENMAEYNEENPLEIDYLIVDEVSMVDIYLMRNLLNAISLKTALILVGDSDQLPSVGPGNVLQDMLDSGITSVRLKKIFRQAGQSNIIVNAHRINEGYYPVVNQKEKDFFFIGTRSYDFNKTLVNLVKNRLPSYYKLDPINDIQILSPTKKSDWGVESINKILQKELNPNSKYLKINNKIFKQGDKVMQIRNNYDLKVKDDYNQVSDGVYNGDIGIVEEIDKDEKSLRVRFYDGALVDYKKEDIKDLDLSYAITIHKSQGSEFDCVIIPMMQAPYMLLNRNLLYTGVTRAKKLLILLGEKRILMQMVDNTRSTKRITNLSYWIREMGEVLDD